VYDKKTIICETPKHLLYFINKYNITDNYTIGNIMDSLVDLAEKSMYDISNGLVYENIKDYIIMLKLPMNIDIINDYIHILNATLQELILIIVHNDLVGTTKHVVSIDDYKFIMETYRI